MKLRTALFVATLFALAGFGIAQAQTAPAKPDPTGTMLVDRGGMTLYTYDSDHGGTSSCYLFCAQNWPPFVGNAASKPVGDFTLITRTDGSRQWAYDGKPLYYWKNDKAPGDKTGDGIGHVWHVAKP